MFRRLEIQISGEMMRPDAFSSLQSLANGIGISGVAFKEADGKIKILTEGDDNILMQFLDNLQGSTFFYETQNVHADWGEPQNLGNFYIVTSGN